MLSRYFSTIMEYHSFSASRGSHIPSSGWTNCIALNIYLFLGIESHFPDGGKKAVATSGRIWLDI